MTSCGSVSGPTGSSTATSTNRVGVGPVLIPGRCRAGFFWRVGVGPDRFRPALVQIRVGFQAVKIPGRFRACLIQTSPKPTRNFDSLEPYPDLDEGGPEPVRPDTDAQPVNKKVTKKTSLLCSYVALSRARARQSPCTMRGTSRCGRGERVCLIEVSVCRVVGDPRGIRAGSARDPRGIRGQNAGSVALGYAKTEAFRGIRRIRIPLL